MFHYNIVKVSEILNKWNLLKTSSKLSIFEAIFTREKMDFLKKF